MEEPLTGSSLQSSDQTGKVCLLAHVSNRNYKKNPVHE